MPRKSEEQVVVKNVGITVLEGLKTPVEEPEIQFRVTPTDLDGEGVLDQSTLYQISVQLLRAMALTGRLPHSLGDDGWMKVSFKSLPFAYAVMILTLNVALHVYYHRHLAHAYEALKEGITFGHVLYSAMLGIQTIGIGMTVYSWVFETRCMARMYNSTAVLEKKLGSLIPARTVKPVTVTIIKTLLALLYICEATASFTLLVLRYGNEPAPVLLMFTFNMLGNQSHTVTWNINNVFCRTLAVKLENHMNKVLKLGINRAQKIRTCRKAWISIWEQSQMNSQAYSTTVMFCVLSYGVIFVISCYGLIVSVINSDFDEVITTMPYFLWSLILTFSIIETTHQAKKQLGDVFLNKMIHLDKENMDRESLEEVDKFTSVILQTEKAQFTLKECVVIDRPLLVSFLSYTVTYIIVLLQFRQSEEQALESQNDDII